MKPRNLLFAMFLPVCAACASAPSPTPDPAPDSAPVAPVPEGSKATADAEGSKATADAAPATPEVAKVADGAPPAAFDVEPGEGARATCPVSDRPFVVGKDTESVRHEGRFYVFCCPGCAGEFRANPGQYAQR